MSFAMYRSKRANISWFCRSLVKFWPQGDPISRPVGEGSIEIVIRRRNAAERWSCMRLRAEVIVMAMLQVKALKSAVRVAVATLALAGLARPVLAQDILGPDKAACAAGSQGPAALVRVYGFKDRDGLLRVQLYGADPEEFLEKGTKLKRIEVPVTPAGDMSVCVALPRRGEFAMYVLHDRNGNRKWDLSKDGFGFSGNPKLGMSKPDYEDSMFVAGNGVTIVDVILNYRTGLFSVRPLVDRRN
jgi:uncharacterized protein (DUF2141 family)